MPGCLQRAHDQAGSPQAACSPVSRRFAPIISKVAGLDNPPKYIRCCKIGMSCHAISPRPRRARHRSIRLRQTSGWKAGQLWLVLTSTAPASRREVVSRRPKPHRNGFLLRTKADHRDRGWAVWIDPVVLRAITISWNDIRIPIRSWPYHGADEKPFPWFTNHSGRPRLGCRTKRPQIKQHQSRSESYGPHPHASPPCHRAN